MRNILVLLILFYSGLILAQEKKEYVPNKYSYTDTTYDHKKLKAIKYFDEEGQLVCRLSFYDNGKLKSCLNYGVNESFNGEIIYWHSNGGKKLQSFYANGKKVGEDNFGWYEDGVVEYQSKCKNDSCETIFYYPTGEISKINRSVGIELHYREKRCENGNVISRENFTLNEDKYREFYCNGELKLEVSLNLNRAYVGLFKMWFEDQQIRTEGQYLTHKNNESKKDGEWKYFNKKGRLILIEEYQSGELLSQKAL